MPQGWPDFELFPSVVTDGGTSTIYNFPGPKNAKRINYDAVWERKNQAGAEQRRLVENITIEVHCNSASVAPLTGAAFSNFINFQQCDYLACDIGGQPGNFLPPQINVYSGTWSLERVTVADHGNGTATVTISARRVTYDWA